jgi:hypothetical protein
VPVPLSTPLSQLLIAFTIEFDNEFDHRMVEADVGRRLPISMTMWSNFLRFVGDGITVSDLVEAAGIPKSKTLSTVGGMERWRYVFLRPDSEPKRDGWGSKRGLRGEWIVRPTPVGRKTQEIAPPLFGEIEARWEQRFGADTVETLRHALRAVIDGLDIDLPEYLPIVGSANGMRTELEHRTRDATPSHLSALLSQVVLAYTVEYERLSELSLPLTANFVRVIDDTGLDVRDIPATAGVSKEATAMAVKYLAKTGYATADGKLVRLTPTGLQAQGTAPDLHARVERAWRSRELRKATQAILDQQTPLSEGLRPYPEGWRARKKYVEQTNAVIADPTGRLPHYPLVLHRGGWPDGS